MPYLSADDLPESVRHSLPEHAQVLFMKAFNNAYDAHKLEEVSAFRIAWAAVKRQYEKVEGVWRKKDLSSRESRNKPSTPAQTHARSYFNQSL